jgi:ParB/RepB/Spo0J family partition protein
MPSPTAKMDHVSTGIKTWLIEDLDLIHRIEGLNTRSLEREQDIDDLVAYIHANGIRDLPPIRVVIRKVEGVDTIFLTKGHRRVGAFRRAKAEGAPIAGIYAIVDKDMDEAELVAGSISENQGLPLTPEEESRAFDRLMRFGWDVPKIATKIGKSTTHVYARLELLDADTSLSTAVKDKEISTTDAVKIVKKAKKTGLSQEDLLAHHKATHTDGRKTRHHPGTAENHIRSMLIPLVEKYGYDQVEKVMHELPEFVGAD